MLSVGLKIGNSLNSSGRWTPALQECCRASGRCCCLCRRNKPGAFPQKFSEISTCSVWDELLGLCCWKTSVLQLRVGTAKSTDWGGFWGKKKKTFRNHLFVYKFMERLRNLSPCEARSSRMGSSEGISNEKVSVKMLKIPIFSDSWCRGGCTLCSQLRNLTPRFLNKTRKFWICCCFSAALLWDVGLLEELSLVQKFPVLFFASVGL